MSRHIATQHTKQYIKFLKNDINEHVATCHTICLRHVIPTGFPILQTTSLRPTMIAKNPTSVSTNNSHLRAHQRIQALTPPPPNSNSTTTDEFQLRHSVLLPAPPPPTTSRYATTNEPQLRDHRQILPLRLPTISRSATANDLHLRTRQPIQFPRPPTKAIAPPCPPLQRPKSLQNAA